MQNKIRDNDAQILVRYVISFLLVCLSIKFFFFNPIFADANAFFVAGRRVLNGELDQLYANISGSGPFIYLPHTSPVFALISIFAGGGPYISFNPYSGFSFLALIYMVLHITKERSDSTLILLGNMALVTLFFAHMIWESVYIGQIDLILVLAAYLGCFTTKARWVVAMSLAWIIKPPLIIFSVISLKTKRAGKVFLIFLVSNISLFFLYWLISNQSFYSLVELIINRLEHLYNMGYSFKHAVIDQSFFGLVGRVFNSDFVGGRYWPELFQARTYPIFWKLLDAQTIKSIHTAVCFFSLCFIAWSFRRANSQQLFGLVSSLIPTVTSLFWHVHIVWMIPAFLILSTKYLELGDYRSLKLLMWTGILLLVSNHFLFSPRVADIVLAFGSNYLFSVGLVLLYIRDIRLNDKVL